MNCFENLVFDLAYFTFKERRLILEPRIIKLWSNNYVMDVIAETSGKFLNEYHGM